MLRFCKKKHLAKLFAIYIEKTQLSHENNRSNIFRLICRFGQIFFGKWPNVDVNMGPVAFVKTSAHLFRIVAFHAVVGIQVAAGARVDDVAVAAIVRRPLPTLR
jgi:hypothetical protein